MSEYKVVQLSNQSPTSLRIWKWLPLTW